MDAAYHEVLFSQSSSPPKGACSLWTDGSSTLQDAPHRLHLLPEQGSEPCSSEAALDYPVASFTGSVPPLSAIASPSLKCTEKRKRLTHLAASSQSGATSVGDCDVSALNGGPVGVFPRTLSSPLSALPVGLRLQLQRQRFFSSTSLNEDNSAIPTRGESTLSWELQQVFSDQSTGLLVARFLRPSEIRALIVMLQLQQQSVVGYFELLCTFFLSKDELDEMLSEYSGTLFGPSMRPKRHWVLPSDTLDVTNGSSISTKLEQHSDVEFLGATVDSSFGEGAARSLPFELVYKIEVFARYCDECQRYMAAPKSCKPHWVRVLKASCTAGAPRRPVLIKQEINEDGSTPCSKDASEATVVGNYFTVDTALATVILCQSCTPLFVTRESIEPVWLRLCSEIPLLKHCRCLPETDTYRLSFDHIGTVVSRSLWDDVHKRVAKGRQVFMGQFRNHFAKRMARCFGQSFYQTFIHKILPCDRFLELDAKQRVYNPLPWVSRLLTTGKRKSRFQHGPYIDRYPLGSLERSTAYHIFHDFETWSSSSSVEALMAAEARLVRIFRLAWNVVHHPDYAKAASVVEDYILTRDIDRDLFDRMYLPSLWRVLHRGSTREPRRFTSCIYDRQRIDKFFAPCCRNPKPPMLPVQGYLGLEHIDPASQNAVLAASPPSATENVASTIKVGITKRRQNTSKTSRKKKARSSTEKGDEHPEGVSVKARIAAGLTTAPEHPAAVPLSGADHLQAVLNAAGHTDVIVPKALASL